MLICHPVSSLVKCPLKSFAIFSVGFLDFELLSVESFLYILGTKYALLDMRFADIFYGLYLIFSISYKCLLWK